MRFKSLSLAFLTVLTLLATDTSAVGATDDVVFTGSGWGHGMGLSQWGAYARALDGQDGEEIVTSYYPTTSVVTISEAPDAGWVPGDEQPVWVNMLGVSSSSNRSSFQIRASHEGLFVCQQEPRTEATWSLTNNGSEYSIYVEILEQRLLDFDHDPGLIDGYFDTDTDSAVRSFQTAMALASDGIVGRNTKAALWEPDSGDRCVIQTPLPTSTVTVTVDEDGNCPVPGAFAVGDCLGSIRDLSPGGRVVLPQKLDSGVPVELAHGDIRIRPDIDSNSSTIEGVHVVLEVGMEDYVSGIDEVMTWWTDVGASAALEAQAIAARTYGLRLMVSYGNLGQENGSTYPYTDTQAPFKTQRDRCWCHLYSTSLSQVYNGWTREIEDGGKWPAAVAATVDSGSGEGKVLTTPDDGVIWAFYTSSNGGTTESHAGYNGYEPPTNFAYLDAVPDPYSLTEDNPFASWTKQYTPEYVASRLGFDELVGIDVASVTESGSAKTVDFHGLVDGEPTVVAKTGAWVDGIFGLRSRYFDVEWGDTSGGTPSPPPPDPDPSYVDIDGHLFEGDIEWAQTHGIAFACNAPANDRFCPDDAVTREVMAVFMVSALDLPPTTVDYFTDDEDSPYEDEINRMAEANITRGCGGTRFCPHLEVDRGQMAAFLGRAFGLKDNGGGDLFVDDNDSIFEGDIDRLGTAGITRGCNPPANTRYCPELDVERGAMMAFLHRASDG